MRAWFLNKTSLKGLNKARITNPTNGFKELIQRATKMERKRTKKGSSSSSEVSNSSESSELEEEPIKKKQKYWQAEIRMIKSKIEELSSIKNSMSKNGEKWFVPCRVNIDSTTEGVTCKHCERRGNV